MKGKGIREINKGNAIGLEFTEQAVLSGDVTLDGTGFKFSKQVGGTKATLAYAATITADCKEANIFDLTVTGNVTSLDAKNLTPGSTYLFIIRQDSTGSHTVAFATKFHFEGGSAPTITATASAVDVVSGIYDGSAILCSIVQDIKAT